MKKILLVAIFAVVVMSGSIAAPAKGSDADYSAEDYFPLVEGRHYRYQDKKTGLFYDAVVSKTTTVMGDEVYKIYFADIDYAVYFEHDEKGFRLYQEDPEADYSEVYKIPITLIPSDFNDKYSSKKLYTYQGHVGSGFSSVGATVVSVKVGLKTVTVPIGVYDTICVAIKTKWIDHDNSKGGTATVLYGAEDIGIVRISRKGTSKIPGLGSMKIQADLYIVAYWD